MTTSHEIDEPGPAIGTDEWYREREAENRAREAPAQQANKQTTIERAAFFLVSAIKFARPNSSYYTAHCAMTAGSYVQQAHDVLFSDLRFCDEEFRRALRLLHVVESVCAQLIEQGFAEANKQKRRDRGRRSARESAVKAAVADQVRMFCPPSPTKAGTR